MVTVVGAGVSGLTTAVVLRRAGLDVEVVTDRPPDELVSWVAAAIWTIPDLTGEQPMAGWAVRAREVFADLAARDGTGVSPLYHRELFREDPGPSWWETTPWVERLDPPAGYAAALGVHGFVIDPSEYLPWLRHEFELLGGTVTNRHLTALDEVDGDVVHASGLGAELLADDAGMYPIRGQVVAVTAPAVGDGISDESDPDRIAYVYPRRHEVILGGMRQVGVADRAEDPFQTERILADTAILDPRLVGASIVDVRVGLRPGRDRVRVEIETDGARRIVHNYGHAGQGYLLSWGCAELVLALLTDTVEASPPRQTGGGYRRAMDARDALTMWVRDGLLPADLAERLSGTLAEPEPGPEPEPDESHSAGSKLTRLLVFVGAVLVGGGLLLFISSQWDESSPTRRLLLMFGVYLMIVGSAALAERQRLRTTARAMWVLSSIAVGVNIFLIGQIFNLALNYWQGTLLWMVACLAMGWAAPSSAQGWLAVPLGLLTLGWVSVPSTQFFEQAEFVIDAAGIRPLLPLVGVAMVAGAALTAGTQFSWLGRPLRAFGALLVAVPLTISTFHPMVFAGVFEIDLRLFHVVVGVASLAVIGAVWIRQRHPLMVMAVPAVLGMLLVLLPQVDVDGEMPLDLDYFDSIPWLAEPFAESALLFGIYTAVIFAFALGTVAAGLQFGVPALVNVGVGVMGVLLSAVYVGRLAGTLPTSLAVLLGGLLLVGGGVLLERKRRDLLVEAGQ